MDSRRLRHFLTVYEHGSVGRAAEVLNLTQPALSKSLHQLEDELGVKLFDRTPLGVVPTVYGRTLSHHAKVIQSELHSAERELAHLTGARKGEVIVGIGPSIATRIMPEATMRLHAERPGIQLTVIEGLADDHIPALRRGEIDLAIGNWPLVSDPNLAAETLMSDDVVVVAGARHPLAGKTVQLAELLEYPWALPSRSQIWRAQLDELFVAKGLAPPPPRVVAANAAAFLRALVQHGDYLSFLPRQVVALEERAGAAVALRVPEIHIRCDINVTYRERGGVTPACQALIAILEDLCGHV
jgi:DNA-binding transcriptional LysR family regulator